MSKRWLLVTALAVLTTYMVAENAIYSLRRMICITDTGCRGGSPECIRPKCAPVLNRAAGPSGGGCCWNNPHRSCNVHGECTPGGEGCIASGTRTLLYDVVTCANPENTGVFELCSGSRSVATCADRTACPVTWSTVNSTHCSRDGSVCEIGKCQGIPPCTLECKGRRTPPLRFFYNGLQLPMIMQAVDSATSLLNKVVPHDFTQPTRPPFHLVDVGGGDLSGAVAVAAATDGGTAEVVEWRPAALEEVQDLVKANGLADKVSISNVRESWTGDLSQLTKRKGPLVLQVHHGALKTFPGLVSALRDLPSSVVGVVATFRPRAMQLAGVNPLDFLRAMTHFTLAVLDCSGTGCPHATGFAATPPSVDTLEGVDEAVLGFARPSPRSEQQQCCERDYKGPCTGCPEGAPADPLAKEAWGWRHGATWPCKSADCGCTHTTTECKDEGTIDVAVLYPDADDQGVRCSLLHPAVGRVHLMGGDKWTGQDPCGKAVHHNAMASFADLIPFAATLTRPVLVVPHSHSPLSGFNANTLDDFPPVTVLAPYVDPSCVPTIYSPTCDCRTSPGNCLTSFLLRPGALRGFPKPERLDISDANGFISFLRRNNVAVENRCGVLQVRHHLCGKQRDTPSPVSQLSRDGITPPRVEGARILSP